jgi:hypothetical protein
MEKICNLNFAKKISVFVSIFILLLVNKNIFSDNLPWKQKLIIKDFSGNYKGWVEIFISTFSTENKQNYLTISESNTLVSEDDFNQITNKVDTLQTKYIAIIVTDTNLPFWFFAGKSKTYEYEFYDKNFIPLESYFYLQGEDVYYKIITKKSLDAFTILWEPKIKKSKEKIIPIKTIEKDVLTAGNLRNIVMNLDLTRKDIKKLFLLDKFKMEIKPVTISSTGKKHIINNIETYRINIDLNIIGKFSFYVDENYNVVYGEGMGIKVFPEKTE